MPFKSALTYNPEPPTKIGNFIARQNVCHRLERHFAISSGTDFPINIEDIDKMMRYGGLLVEIRLGGSDIQSAVNLA
jgi:hypothetical protein